LALPLELAELELIPIELFEDIELFDELKADVLRLLSIADRAGRLIEDTALLEVLLEEPSELYV
jgi:hypothetical protein